MTTSEKMRYSSLSFCAAVLFLVLVLHPEVTRASPIPFQNLDFVVDLTDETFEHETQASTGQTTGSWLVWFYNDKESNNEPEQQHRNILGLVPEGGSIFSDYHIVLGSVGLSKTSRTRQRFGVKPKDLPALVFIHKGKYFVYPKGKSESFYFNWDSIVRFAFHIAGYKQPSSGEESGAGDSENSSNNSIFANLQAHDIPDPKTGWDDFQDFLSSVVNEGGFFFICVSVVFGGLGIAALFNKQKPQKEKPKKKQS